MSAPANRPGSRRQPGRGAWLRDVKRWAPACLDAAEFIAPRNVTFVADVPTRLRAQFWHLDTMRHVRIQPDGFVYRGHGPRNTSTRPGGRTHDHHTEDH